MSPEERRDRHLLVVDDDDRIRKLLKEFLVRAGFRVSTAADAAGADKLCAALDFDLMVLDVMMPGEDGFAFTKRLRAMGGEVAKTPILMLTARDQAADRIEGLTHGVDDYLGKPFEPQELLLRIEAILRRTAAKPSGPRELSLGRCSFEPERGELTCDGQPVRLTEAEVALMRRLARSAHEPVDRLELARDTADTTGRAIDVQVTRLRRKIEPDPKNPRYLQTVRGIGYRLAPD
ncbi:MAG: DNA-binding response regulator [Caulobacter sp. 12-67-6]|nr:MAG: DNA-binding response regulator [Caulobacter sp. 12-67-6]OYX71931.1 MAG: DNA-binding response regulator [Caulobacter sp. 32-67-35]OYX99106.1 MAG: DNA-binding response regulator [Caulobacter sp. 35-67-4]OZA71424.1 MAG: DNA-binding response regulator [Caulobacter sp. 39-67-4]HQR90590.1 response regulator [Caulobacter sp.]